jgi:hypothetical protein
MKYSIDVKGKATKVREDIVELRDYLDLIIKQEFAQVAYLDVSEDRDYSIGIDPSMHGLAMVVTKG